MEPISTGSSVVNKFKLLSVEDLLTMPSPDWLIEGVVRKGVLAVLYAAPESGKSFVALDFALSVATGEPWHGHETQQGPVVYIIGEGSSGMPKRLKAYLVKHGIADVPHAFFLHEAPQLLEPSDVDQLIGVLGPTTPSLVVIDTMARCFAGDENSSQDVGAFVAACRRLQVVTGAAVLLLHHTTKSTKSERGSGALRAAADVMIYQELDGNGVVTIENDKQKDDERFRRIRLRTEEVSFTDYHGKKQQSLVLVDGSQCASIGSSPSGLYGLKYYQ